MTPPTSLQCGMRLKLTDHNLFLLIWCRKHRYRIGGGKPPPYDGELPRFCIGLTTHWCWIPNPPPVTPLSAATRRQTIIYNSNKE